MRIPHVWIYAHNTGRNAETTTNGFNFRIIKSIMESWRVPLTLLDCKLVPIFWIRSRICFEWCKANTSWLFTSMLQVLISEQVSNTATSGLCSSRAQWPLAPNFCPRATRKSQIFHTNHMLGTLDFTVSEYWAPFNFS